MQYAHYKTINKVEKKHWWYRTRRKIIHDLIRKYGRVESRNVSILDVGCGAGTLLKELERYGNSNGLDLSEEAVSFCKEKGIENVSIGNVTELPFQSDSFDIVLILDVIEHVEDDSLAIMEVCRVMKKGGIAIITVPTFKFMWSITDELSNHHRRYIIKDLRNKVNNNSLYIIRSSYFNTFLFIPIVLVRLAVRLLNIPIKSETETGDGIINAILYKIFHIESTLLKYTNFPFGVSAFVVCRK